MPKPKQKLINTFFIRCVFKRLLTKNQKKKKESYRHNSGYRESDFNLKSSLCSKASLLAYTNADSLPANAVVNESLTVLTAADTAPEFHRIPF